MTHVPFPPAIAEAYADETRARYEASKTGRKPQIGETRTHRGLAFKMPCGTVRGVYNRYQPEHPKGSTAGWAMIHETLNFYPNGTQGYEIVATDFEPLDEPQGFATELTPIGEQYVIPDCEPVAPKSGNAQLGLWR